MTREDRTSVRTAASLHGRDEALVRELTAVVRAADGVEPLSEHSLLHLEAPGSTHVLGYAGDRLAGYAQVWDDGSAELAVDPARRREGLGSVLWGAAQSAGAKRVWAHGDLPAARGFAAAAALDPVRELRKMGRPLHAADRDDVEVPPWTGVETFADRDDPQEWVALNAAAFAHHPEQGRLTVEDFAARAAEPWFDPRGLIYLLDENAPADAPPIAFHWTKVEPREETGTGWTGEVYAVGIDPAYQGRGLAGPLTRLGLAHLARRGLSDVVLYVDGDNAAAVRTYEKAGMRTLTVDMVYAPASEAVRMRT